MMRVAIALLLLLASCGDTYTPNYGVDASGDPCLGIQWNQYNGMGPTFIPYGDCTVKHQQRIDRWAEEDK